MSARRGAVKVNPVTGKMERLTEEEMAAAAGGHRDGCLKLGTEYIDAARNLGLGAPGGMYTHIKSLARVGGSDLPTGTTMEKEGVDYSADPHKKPAAAAASGGSGGGRVDATNTEAVKDAIKTHVATVGKARVAGFGPTSSAAGSGVHGHADAFQRRKGVVNTLGGAKDVVRAKPEPAPGIPAKGAKIMDVSGLDSHRAEGRAKRDAAERKMAEGAATRGVAPKAPVGITGFSKTGGITTVSGGAAKGAHVSASVTASRGAGAKPAAAAAAAPAAEPVHSVRGPGHVVGGGGTVGSSAAAGGDAGMSDAERRAAFFKKQMAEKAAKTAAAVEMLKGTSE